MLLFILARIVCDDKCVWNREVKCTLKAIGTARLSLICGMMSSPGTAVTAKDAGEVKHIMEDQLGPIDRKCHRLQRCKRSVSACNFLVCCVGCQERALSLSQKLCVRIYNHIYIF